MFAPTTIASVFTYNRVQTIKYLGIAVFHPLISLRWDIFSTLSLQLCTLQPEVNLCREALCKSVTISTRLHGCIVAHTCCATDLRASSACCEHVQEVFYVPADWPTDEPYWVRCDLTGSLGEMVWGRGWGERSLGPSCLPALCNYHSMGKKNSQLMQYQCKLIRSMWMLKVHIRQLFLHDLSVWIFSCWNRGPEGLYIYVNAERGLHW